MTKFPLKIEDHILEIEASLNFLGSYLERRFLGLDERHERAAAREDIVARKLDDLLRHARRHDDQLSKLARKLDLHVKKDPKKK